MYLQAAAGVEPNEESRHWRISKKVQNLGQLASSSPPTSAAETAQTSSIRAAISNYNRTKH